MTSYLINKMHVVVALLSPEYQIFIRGVPLKLDRDDYIFQIPLIYSTSRIVIPVNNVAYFLRKGTEISLTEISYFILTLIRTQSVKWYELIKKFYSVLLYLRPVIKLQFTLQSNLHFTRFLSSPFIITVTIKAPLPVTHCNCIALFTIYLYCLCKSFPFLLGIDTKRV